MKVSMTVGGEKLEYDVHEQLFFDPGSVFEELGSQPGQVAWWYSLLTIKEQEAEDFKTDMESTISGIELEYRSNSEDLAKTYGKVTESVISAALNLDARVLDLRKKYSTLRREVGLLKAMTRGQDTRSNLLSVSGSAQKVELQARLRSLIASTKEES